MTSTGKVPARADSYAVLRPIPSIFAASGIDTVMDSMGSIIFVLHPYDLYVRCTHGNKLKTNCIHTYYVRKENLAMADE
jgi:hypothetical protein